MQVSNILEELNLNKVRYSRIGSTKETRGISGGELKRLSVAQELLVDPSLIMLDEPTSGFQELGLFLNSENNCHKAQPDYFIFVTI